MSYQVIARKYRPQRFEDVVGQEHVTQTLANAIRSGRIAHAYLFCGPRGTGKTTVARIFAKALNCTGGPKADFDDSDPRCREIAEGRSLDVLEIDGASNNGVEQVRELRDTARFAPASSKFKIYIIDEVHMLTTAAFNALLKTLEEPPAHVKFLFATTDPEKVLPTILSRCQRFDLRRIPASLIVQHLASIATAENVVADPAALHAIARGADGGMRDAESTLDQLISFCGDKIEEPDVLSMFGLAARSQLLSLTRGLLQGDAPTALRELNELARNGKDLGRLLNDLLSHFRNLLVFQVAGGDLDLLEVSELEAAEIKEQAAAAPSDAVARMLDVLTAAEGKLRDAAARKIFLEVTLMKAIQARNSVSLDTVIRQLQQWRTEAGEPAKPAPAPVHAAIPGPVATPRPQPLPAVAAAAPPPIPASQIPPRPASPPEASPAAAAATTPALADLPTLWAQVVASASPLSRGALQTGQPVSLEKGVLTVAFPASLENQLSLIDTDRSRKTIETRIAEWGRTVTLRFIRSGSLLAPTPAAPASPSTSSPAPARPAAPATPPAPAKPATPAAARPATEKVVPIKIDPVEFKNDPLIKEALELFKGTLVEIRRAEEPKE